MKIKNLFIMSLALVACACQDDEGMKPVPTPGANVQFGGSINQNSLTRTIYGDEANGGFPIYWLTGDQVIVASPQCEIKQGTYQVPDGANGQDYAGEFTKVGDAGVQWGTDAQADFYSIYPAKNVSVGSNHTSFTMSIPTSQESTIEELKTGVFGVKPNMDACFMYAKTPGVANGNVVNLGYHPLSTAIRFTMSGPLSTTGGSNQEPAVITKIVLHAPEGVAISGDFTVELSGDTPAVTPGSNTSNEVEIVPTYKESEAYLTLETDETIEVNAFIIPQNNITITDKWYIQITLNNGTTYKKTLDLSTTEGSTPTLQAGKIHRLPKLPPFKMDVTWDPSDWMKNIPRNVYLSEISIPGSWNTVNKNFQSQDSNGETIKKQYNIGVRAFHLDVSWRANTNLIGNATNIIDLGIADGTTRNDKFESIYNVGKCMTSDAKQFSTALKEITSQVKQNEYMVLMCSFAQDSYDWPDKSWMQAISDECVNNEKVIDGSTITANTVVGDVLGKVIVVIGCENAISGLELPTDSKCIFSHLPMTLSESQFSPYTPNLYNHDAIYKSDNITTGIEFYNVHSQIHPKTDGNDAGSSNTGGRGYAPTLTQHENIAKNILEWSRTNYEKQEFKHNAWIYLGLGGYYAKIGGLLAGTSDGGHHEVAQRLNTWMTNKIDKMSSRPTGDQTGYYPVGIVLMNFVETATDYGPSTVGEIYQLNTKYRKASDPNWTPGNNGTSGTSDVQSAAPGYSTGVTDNGEDAFGWTQSN